MGWERLPSPCLQGIISFLDAHDRLSFKDVCPTWSLAASSPASWRHVSITVTRGDHRARIKILLTSIASGVRNLNLIWDLRSSDDFSVYYLKALIAAQVVLTSLTLTNASHSYKLANRSRMLFLIAKLLRAGRIEEIWMEGAWVRGGELCRLLKACGPSLSRLHISGASRTPAPSLPLILPELPRLSHLTIDCTAMSGELLGALSRGAPCLVRLGIRARLQQFPPIPSSAWAALRTPHPNLAVSLEIYSMLRHDQLSSCLHPDIPLISLTWCCERLAGEAPIGEIIRKVMQTVAANYTHCLEVLVILTKNCNESLDDVIVHLMKSCQRLQTFNFQGFIKSLKTVSEIMKNDTEKRFNYIEVQPKHLTRNQRKYVEKILREHEITNPNPQLTLRIRDPVPLAAFH